MKNLGWAMVGLVTLMSPTSISAKPAYYGGQKLFEVCEGKKAWELGFCGGFIFGAINELELIRAMADKPSCLPEAEISAATLMDVVINYMRKHPEERHLPAAALVGIALADAYGYCGS